MNEQTAAKALSALGHEARLRIFRLLVRAGHDGLNIGDIGKLTGLPPSTLAHHLSHLVDGELVSQERIGRVVINRVEFNSVRGVLDFIESECCQGVSLENNTAA